MKLTKEITHKSIFRHQTFSSDKVGNTFGLGREYICRLPQSQKSSFGIIKNSFGNFVIFYAAEIPTPVHFLYLLFFSYDDGKGFNRRMEGQTPNSNVRNKKHFFDAGFNLLTHSNSHHKNGNTFITVLANAPSRPRPRCCAVPFGAEARRWHVRFFGEKINKNK